ncbi:MAG: hypothetical protein KME59_20480 [Trichormus sp. ATA11-4-KO1]|jgi:hypothetical protein|nr:hypothetical protein [Trichormus sp. ATA11-4-KO1]
MIDILVKIYSDEKLTKYLSAYRLNFVAVPRVSDFISKNVNIKESLDCCVKEIIFIPKHEGSQDCDVFLKCLQADISSKMGL